MITLIELELLYRKYRIELKNDGKPFKFTRLKTFISYCVKRGCNYLSKELIDEWCIKRPTESVNSANHRIAELRNFIKYANSRQSYKISMPSLLPEARNLRKKIPMTEMPIQNPLFLKCLKNIFLT